MYVVVISLNGQTNYHEHDYYDNAVTQWARATRDARDAMLHMGSLATLFDAKIYMTRFEDNKRKIIMAFDSKGTIDFQ